ncbi:hypothetical protein ACFL6I_16995 [candidate division KSB1 bacterium]
MGGGSYNQYCPDRSYYESILRKGRSRTSEHAVDPEVQKRIKQQIELEEFFRDSIDPFNMPRRKDYVSPAAEKVKVTIVNDVLTFFYQPIPPGSGKDQ